MHRESSLPNTELIFYLTRDEIRTLMEKQPRTGPTINKGLIINKAMRRMKMFSIWNTYRFNEINNGVLKPISDSDAHHELLANGDGACVRGMPVCEGIVTGRACVIRSFSNVSEIRPGDILITHSTDIGWSPYFPILGGVVTELGGLLSHGK